MWEKTLDLFCIVLCLAIFAAAGISVAEEPRAGYISNVMINSSPSGTGVWQREGKSVKYLGTTPLTHVFNFRSDKDVKRLLFNRSGYNEKAINLRTLNKKLSVILKKVKKLVLISKTNSKRSHKLKALLSQKIYSNEPDPFASDRFSVNNIELFPHKEGYILKVFVITWRGFGGRDLKAAYRIRHAKKKKYARIVQVIYNEAGIKVLKWVRTLIARLPEINQISVAFSYTKRGHALIEKSARVFKVKNTYTDRYLIVSFWHEIERHYEIADKKVKSIVFLSVPRNKLLKDSENRLKLSEIASKGQVGIINTKGEAPIICKPSWFSKDPIDL